MVHVADDDRNTRLNKLDAETSPFDALILAISGLRRIDCADRITSPISSPIIYHAVGQGALGVEIRGGDARVREAIRGIGHWQTEWRCGAERGCLRVLEGGCSVPVGVESELEELPLEFGQEENPRDEAFNNEVFGPVQSDSPMLWFSGVLDPSTPLPISRPPSPSSSHLSTPLRPLPPLRPRRARMTIRVCVTSLDGSSQVVYAPPPAVVRNYQEAERWGEICATHVKQSGGKEILDEVGRVRRERERRDFERALEKSRQEINGGDGGGSNQQHEGLQQLVRTLAGETERAESGGV